MNKQAEYYQWIVILEYNIIIMIPVTNKTINFFTSDKRCGSEMLPPDYSKEYLSDKVDSTKRDVPNIVVFFIIDFDEKTLTYL